MLPVNKARGLEYRKLDLHVHTKASEDFQGDIQPSEIVEEAIRKGLDGIAITDHNSGKWIDLVKEAAKGTELVIFPGVEISCQGGAGGIHLIALFSPERDTAHIQGVLSALGIPPDKQGSSETLAKNSILEVIDIIQSDTWQGIAVLAHVNSSKGIFHDMKGNQRTEIIQHPSLLAVEATDFQNDDAKAKKKRAIDLLDGNDPVYKRKLAVYQASDNPHAGGHGHSLDAIGTRFSYFKMEKIDLDSLRQCLSDPEVRIKQDFELNPQTYPLIKKIKVTGGFLDGLEIEFHSGLNSILGAKGAGKSLLIEFLRFVLGQSPTQSSIYDDHEGKLASRLGQYSYVEVIVSDSTGKEYHIKRTYTISAENSSFEVPYEPAQVLPVLFLSQNEIIKIAEDEDQQLKFIDQFFDFRPFKAEIKSLEVQLEDLDHQMAEGLKSYSEIKDLETELASLDQELERLNVLLASPVFEEYNLAQKKDLTVNSQSKHIKSLSSLIGTFRDRLSNLSDPLLPSELANDPALKRNHAALTKARNLIDQEIESLIAEISKHTSSLEREKTTWQKSFDITKRKYEEHVQQAGGDYRALASERESKVKRADGLRTSLLEANKRKEALGPLSDKRKRLLDELEDTYNRYTKERQNKAQKFQQSSGEKLRLTIKGSSNVDEFRQRLLELKQGSYLRESEIDAICTKIKPREFIFALLRYLAAISGGKSGKPAYTFLEAISKDSNISLERMIKLADFLTGAINPKQLLSLQYKAVPQDRPEILFNIGENEFKPLSAVSIGQKSTALLLMALSDGTMPIAIDQPEDSLDIRSIWEDICLKLRDGKNNRQFIFTTHNSSIAVASDTDYFVVLESTSSQGKVVYTGAMDHGPVAEEVLRYLEGGLPTYRRKFQKYRGDTKLRQA